MVANAQAAPPTLATGSITGVIDTYAFDDTGAAIVSPRAGVTVGLSGTMIITKTDQHVRFTLANVPVGVWTVMLSEEANGYLCSGLIPNLQVAQAGQVVQAPGLSAPAVCSTALTPPSAPVGP